MRFKLVVAHKGRGSLLVRAPSSAIICPVMNAAQSRAGKTLELHYVGELAKPTQSVHLELAMPGSLGVCLSIDIVIT